MRFGKPHFTGLIVAALIGCSATETSENTPYSVPGLPLDEAVALPELWGHAPVQLDVLLSASTTQVSVDGVPVQALVTGADQRAAVPESDLKGAFVVSLYDALLDKAERSKSVAEMSADGVFRGRLLMQLDKTLSPKLMRQLMYTAGQAQFGEMRLLGEDPSTQELSAKSVLLPVIGPPQTPESFEQNPEEMFGPQLSVRLGTSGFSLFAGGHTVDAFGAGASKTKMTLTCAEPCAGLDSYPWDELAEVLSGFRAQFPAECSPAGRLWKEGAPVSGEERAEGGPPPNASAAKPSGERALVEALLGEHMTPPDYGYLPSSCVLAIDLNGRLDLPWWWWLRLTGGYTVGAIASDPGSAKPDLFPYWVLFSGPLEGELEEVVAYRYVPTCQDTDCVAVAPLIQRDPRVPHVVSEDRVPDTEEVFDELSGSQSELPE